MRRRLRRDHWLDVAKLGVEAAKKIEHLARLGDGVVDVAQLVGDPFEFGAVVVDGQVALHHGTQLDLEVDDALHFIVLEEPLDGVPEGECVVAVAADNVEESFGYGGEYPVDDA